MPAADNAHKKSARLVIRNAEAGDIDDIIALQKRAFPKLEPDAPGMIKGRLERFPEGQFVVELDGELAGWASTFIVDEAVWRGSLCRPQCAPHPAGATPV